MGPDGARSGARDWDRCTAPSCAGARLGDQGLCLGHLDETGANQYLARFRRGRPLDARGVTISRALLERIVAAVPLGADGRRRVAAARFEGASFESDLVLDDTVFGSGVSFDDARFHGTVDMGHSTFEGPCRFAQARFENDATFDGAEFRSQAWFMEAMFCGDASFSEVSFMGPAWFGRVVFEADALFYGAQFAGHAAFDLTAFGCHSEFSGSVFHADPHFDEATFARPPTFSGTSFRGRGGTPEIAMGQRTEWSGPPLASWRQRAHADLVDAVVPIAIIAAGILGVLLLLRLQEGAAAVVAGALAAVAALTWVVRNLARQGQSGQTVGKRAAGLRLVGVHSQRPVGATRSVVRQVLHLADSIPAFLGWLWPLVDRRRQTFADKMASTVVVVVGGNWAVANEAGPRPKPS